jgi:hypothetical protein
MDDGLKVYWDALSRMEEGIPLIVSPDAEINYDTVALEAGRSRGSLKASRPQHANIRDAIERAAKKVNDARSAGVPVSKAELKGKLRQSAKGPKVSKHCQTKFLLVKSCCYGMLQNLKNKLIGLRGCELLNFQKNNQSWEFAKSALRV